MKTSVPVLVLATLLMLSVSGDVANAEDHSINFFVSAFLPTSVIIEAGDTVTWNWVA